MASSQHTVQAYLQKHRIGGLFEDLMSRLIKELPPEPLPYLIKIITRMDDRQRKQENPLTRARPSTGLPAGRRSVGGIKSVTNPDHLSRSADTKAMWASSDTALKKSGRGYDKPWSSNMKKTKLDENKEIENTTRKLQKPQQDFDELFQETQKAKSKTVAFSKGVSQPVQWAGGDIDELKYTSSFDRRRKIMDMDDDPLSGELTAEKLEKKYGRSNEHDKNMSSKTRRSLTKRDQTHKDHIATLAQQHAASKPFLDIGDDSMNGDDGDYDDATELLEDADDLRREGVFNAKVTGHRVNRSHHRQVEPEASVKISICSKCARLAGAESGSEYDGQSNPYRSLGNASEYAGSQPGGFETVGRMSDDEFESISQVEGPRYPVWEESDVEPRLTSRSQKMTIGQRSPVSDVLESLRTSKGWDTMTHRSVTEVVQRGGDLTEKGRSWHSAPSDDESSFDWNTDRNGKSTRFTKSGRPPSGN